MPARNSERSYDLWPGHLQRMWMWPDEELFTVIASMKEPEAIDGRYYIQGNAQDLREDLEFVAHRHDRESITLTLGEPEVLTAKNYIR